MMFTSMLCTVVDTWRLIVCAIQLCKCLFQLLTVHTHNKFHRIRAASKKSLFCCHLLHSSSLLLAAPPEFWLWKGKVRRRALHQRNIDHDQKIFRPQKTNVQRQKETKKEAKKKRKKERKKKSTRQETRINKPALNRI